MTHVENAGWVFRAGNRTVAMDVALLDELGVTREQRIAFFEAMDLVTYTHQHADHLHQGDAEVLGELGRPTVICHPDAARKLYDAGVTDKQVIELSAGQSTEVGDIRVQALQAHHRSVQIPHCIAPAVTAGGVTVVDAGDNRRFEPPSLNGADGCDVLIHCFYAYDEERAREGELTWIPELLEEQARFLASLRPNVVLISHISEFRHAYHKLWRFFHASLLKELLFSLDPSIACPILGPGESCVVRR
jgi:L-ascorbate metabolism protein UlaG (beta-lactamase superfamily)